MANPLITLQPPPPRATPVITLISNPRAEVQNDQGAKPRQGNINRPGDSTPAAHNFSQQWSGWFRNLFNFLNQGKTVNIVVGAQTLVFQKGILVDVQ